MEAKKWAHPRHWAHPRGMLLFASGTVLTLVLVDLLDFLNRPRQI